ncbi:sterol desaturase family protein [Pedobacter fastidiosus]|uniref:Sterol desaturase family protein n=1 Tax=Pedobacter fastidiosus TaxID=2765361 RepID=A0ABR7KXJ0_9SPHI|nr:sterol desaturase family protein [Pedobacter fastidiosus]MBC6112462.1 sterol desaturase family protein [Pedobacter fastidiosus]
MNGKPDHSTTLQLFFFATLVIALWNAEILFRKEPLREKWRHTVLNLHFLLTATLVQLPLTLAVIKVSEYTADQGLGILNRLPLPSSFAIRFLMGFLVMDFFEYIYHYMMHKTAFLWSFHLIHHSDTELDVSTTVREHPGETFIRVSFMVLTVYLSGVPLAILLIRQFIQSFSNLMAHTTISYPARLERILRWVFITPGLHKVHHHDSMPYTDSNYGDILCIWDRLFGTYRELEVSEINFGIDTVSPSEIRTFPNLLAYPFLKKEKKQEAEASSEPIPQKLYVNP